jgi:hypothetical protein
VRTTTFVLVLALASFWTLATQAASPFGWLGFSNGPTSAARQPQPTPTVFNKMSAGTKRLVSNTKDALTPDKKPTKKPTKKSGSTTVRKAKRPPAPKQGFFKQLFNPEPPPPPETVQEWMSLEQVYP